MIDNEIMLSFSFTLFRKQVCCPLSIKHWDESRKEGSTDTRNVREEDLWFDSESLELDPDLNLIKEGIMSDELAKVRCIDL